MKRFSPIILIIISLILLSVSIVAFYTWSNYRNITPSLGNQESVTTQTNQDPQIQTPESSESVQNNTPDNQGSLKVKNPESTYTSTTQETETTTESTLDNYSLPEDYPTTYEETNKDTPSTQEISNASETKNTLEVQDTSEAQNTTETKNKPKNDSKNIYFVKADTDEKVIFLTIDDGPGNYTMELLDLLKKYNIKAIFFVSGDTVLSYQKQLKREHEEGHVIGTHTYCHRSYFKLQKTADLQTLKNTLRSDLDKTETNIKKIIPELKIKYLRMPEGYHKDWVEEIAREYGYKILNWTAGYDWLQEPVETTIERYKKSLKPGAIYLLHDGRDRGLKTIKILSEFIPYALSQGYKFGDPEEYF